MILHSPDKFDNPCSPLPCFSTNIAEDRRQQPCGQCIAPQGGTPAGRSLPAPRVPKRSGLRHLSFSHTESCSSCFLPPWTTSGHFSFLPHFTNFLGLPFSSRAHTPRTLPCSSASLKAASVLKRTPDLKTKPNDRMPPQCWLAWLDRLTEGYSVSRTKNPLSLLFPVIIAQIPEVTC